MNTEYLEMPETLLAELGENVALTKEMNYAHKVCNSNGNFLFYCTMYGGKRYKTTKEMKDKAGIFYKINKDNTIKNVGNKLVFVGMGMNYAPRFEGDVCNHRIRTELINPEGRKFFVELGSWGENMRTDFLVDRDLEHIYSDKRKAIRSQIEELGGYSKINCGHPLLEELNKYQEQPEYQFKREEAAKLIKDGIKYTKDNVLKFVNEIFGCNFKEMKVDYYHLTTDDYTSISPKK